MTALLRDRRGTAEMGLQARGRFERQWTLEEAGATAIAAYRRWLGAETSRAPASTPAPPPTTREELTRGRS
jgi:hypothetical protein